MGISVDHQFFIIMASSHVIIEVLVRKHFIISKMLFVFFLYQTSEEFLEAYVKNNSDPYVSFVFDAMWTIALTLNNSMHEIKSTLNKSLLDFTYKDSSMVQILKKTLENVNFQGITVKINQELCLTARARESGFPPKNIPDECCIHVKSESCIHVSNFKKLILMSR